jgi:hypothetical protein
LQRQQQQQWLLEVSSFNIDLELLAGFFHQHHSWVQVPLLICLLFVSNQMLVTSVIMVAH